MIAQIPDPGWLTGPRPRPPASVRPILRSVNMPVRAVQWVAGGVGAVFAGLILSTGDLNGVPGAVLVFVMMTTPAFFWVRSREAPYRRVLSDGEVWPITDSSAQPVDPIATLHTIGFEAFGEARVGHVTVPAEGAGLGEPRHALAVADDPTLAFVVYDSGAILPAACLTATAASPRRRGLRLAILALALIAYLVAFFALAS